MIAVTIVIIIMISCIIMIMIIIVYMYYCVSIIISILLLLLLVVVVVVALSLLAFSLLALHVHYHYGAARTQVSTLISKRGAGYCWLRYCCLELLDRELPSNFNKRSSSNSSNWDIWARWGFLTLSSPLPNVSVDIDIDIQHVRTLTLTLMWRSVLTFDLAIGYCRCGASMRYRFTYGTHKCLRLHAHYNMKHACDMRT